jgi:hypothetical protein
LLWFSAGVAGFPLAFSGTTGTAACSILDRQVFNIDTAEDTHKTMTESEEYRFNAEECERMAEKVP